MYDIFVAKERNEFSRWLEQKYLDWQSERGRRVLLQEFADWLGISKQLLSHYLNGRNVPNGPTVTKLADKLGPEIYDVLGLARPDPNIQPIISAYDEMDEETRQALLHMLEDESQFKVIVGLINSTPANLYMPIMVALYNAIRELYTGMKEGPVDTDDSIKAIAMNILTTIYKSDPKQRVKIEEMLRKGSKEG